MGKNKNRHCSHDFTMEILVNGCFYNRYKDLLLICHRFFHRL